MEGADKWYNIISKAYDLNIGDLKKINCSGYGKGYQYKNIIFVLDEHARGKTFHIWIYETKYIKDAIKDDHLEVYGVTGGQLGWTEKYGWLYDGEWKNFIPKYMNELNNQINQIAEEAKIMVENDKKHFLEVQEQKVSVFNTYFKNNIDR